MKKRVFATLLFVVLGIILMCQPATYAAQKSLVYDDAKLLSDAQKKEVSQAAEKLQKQTGWDVLVVTTKNTNGKTTQKYNDDILEHHLTGNSGISFIIDMANRQVYISTTGDAIQKITNKKINAIIDKGYPHIKKQEYAKAFDAMLGKTYNYVHKSIQWYEALIAILLALAAGGITFGAVVGKYRLKWGTYKYDFHVNSQCNISRAEDHFVNEIVTHHHIERNSSGDGDGGSSVHTSDSGRDFGGGGRSF